MGMIKLPQESIQYFKNNLDSIFRSGNLAEGPWNLQLSDYVKQLTSAKYALPTNSNGAGMVGLLSLYRHYRGRTQVLIQSNTMYGVKTMVGSAGSILAGYINCQLETLMPSIDDVKVCVSELGSDQKDSLIVLLSHIGGIINPDIESIASFCADENIILLEDCAHSFGATLNGNHSGLFGDAGVYSFYATKAVPVGEGGLVVTNDEEIGEKISAFSIYDRFKQQLEIGNNIRISEVQALLTYSVVKEWVQIVENKKYIASKYINACKKYGINYIPQNENGNIGNYYKFVIYNSKTPTKEELPFLVTTTSPVYDYSIGTPNGLAGYHACLPIWYGQDESTTDKVVSELLRSTE